MKKSVPPVCVNIDTHEKLVKHFGEPKSTDEMALALYRGFMPFIKKVEKKGKRRN